MFVQVNGTNEVLQTGIIDVMVSGIGDNIVVDELNLFPTPVQNDMFIDFTIGERNDLVFEVFNTNGQVVSTLANQAFAAGSHRLQFDASELSAGVYFVSIASNEGRQMQKFTVIR